MQNLGVLTAPYVVTLATLSYGWCTITR